MSQSLKEVLHGSTPAATHTQILSEALEEEGKEEENGADEEEREKQSE